MRAFGGKLRFGAHVPFSSKAGMQATIHECISEGMYSAQFFLGNPQSLKTSSLGSPDVVASNLLLDRYPMDLFIHAPYICNCCGSVACLAWQGNEAQDASTSSVIEMLNHELTTLDSLASKSDSTRGVVIHPGSFKDATSGLRAIAETICRIPRLACPGSSVLLLENSAGQGTSLAKTFKEISLILAQIVDINPDVMNRIGVCVDTAHIHGMGQYDLSTVSGVDTMFDDFDRLIGLKRFRLLHLNDSEVKLGSRVDRHAGLGMGTIWGRDMTGLIHLLQKCVDLNIPVVLETGVQLDMEILRVISNEYLRTSC